MPYLTIDGIRKVLITDYYLDFIELIIGLIIIHYFPQIPLAVLFILIGANLIINTVGYILCINKAPVFFLQAMVMLEMMLAALAVSIFAHYFTDLRPTLMLGAYVPVILLSTNLNLWLGVLTVITVIVTYGALSFVESSGIWPIAASLLQRSGCFDWQKNSYITLLFIVMIGLIAVVLRYMSYKDPLRVG